MSHEVIVSLIGSTTAQTGPQIRAELDHNNYPTGIKVTDDELARVRLERVEFHGDWNYTVHPRIDPN